MELTGIEPVTKRWVVITYKGIIAELMGAIATAGSAGGFFVVGLWKLYIELVDVSR